MTPQRFFGVIKRRSLIVWCVIAVGVALMWSLRSLVPASYAAISHVVLVSENGARDPSVSIVDLPSIATGSVVLQRVRQAQQLPISLIDLKKSVSAKVLGKSSIMEIGYKDESAERSIAVSNAIADTLSQYYDEISTQRYDINVDRLTGEMDAQAAKMRQLDTQIKKVAAADPYVISDKSVDGITTELATLDQQRAAAYAQLRGDRALAAVSAPSAVMAKTARHEILASDPAYMTVRANAAHDIAQYVNDRTSYTPAFPGLPGENAKIASDRSALSAQAARALTDPNAYSPSAAGTYVDHQKQLALVSGDEVRLNQIDALIATAKSQLADVPSTGGTYAQLTSQRLAMTNEYEALASRRANALANRAEASSLGSVVVLDRAIKADTQLGGGRARAAVAVSILVLALAIGAAFLVDSLDPRIRRAEELEELYGIPVFASFGQKV
jgi:uncharacterized protein involved in exopolysaccharide biosynthesis